MASISQQDIRNKPCVRSKRRYYSSFTLICSRFLQVLKSLVYYLDLHCQLRVCSFGSEAVRLPEYIDNMGGGLKNFKLLAGFDISVCEGIPTSHVTEIHM